jgi:hypothetical protein
MILPVALIMILLGRYILEGSLNRQEAAVFSRGGTVAAAVAQSTAQCDFSRDAFSGRPSVEQTPEIRCERRNAERGLNRERPVWTELEDAASAWDEILRDVRPRRGAGDYIGHSTASLSLEGPEFFSRQAAVNSAQTYLAPERVFWTHGESSFRNGHDRVIWDELCKRGTYRLFPNVFPKGGGPRC